MVPVDPEKKEKTLKREIAGIMLVFLAGMWLAGVGGNELAFEAAKFLTFPLLGWSGAAFALDWKAKQA